MQKAFIFDWSGTLSDNFHRFSQVCEKMFLELGKEPISDEEIRLTITIPYMEFWNRYFPDLSKEKQDALFEKYVHQVSEPEIFENVFDTIRFLHDSGWKIFILSSDFHSTLIPEVKKSGLFEFFEKIVGEVYEKGGAINALVDEFDLDRKMTYYVGDTSGDVEAGKFAGVKTVGASWGWQHNDKLTESKPDFLIDDIIEIKEIIGR